MYPDRQTFQRMVKDEPNLSGAGRETLLALYDGPLHLRQILEIVNAQDHAAGEPDAKDRNISESALRKRLEVLISRGIIARAGSERTNPYYYIRRPWIFNQYILIKCRDGPSSGLLDLTILLHELSRMTAEGDAALPHPRYISAAGERTERSHQIEISYKAFLKILGNKNAISDYLEGIYEDIYQDKVPESDIDGLITRDFLRFVATAPDEEREVRFFLWFAEFFHILDRYEEAIDAFQKGESLAKEQGLDLPGILAESRMAKSHILLHFNDFAGAKEASAERCQDKDQSPFMKAKNLFWAGEAELFSGDSITTNTLTKFRQALDLCVTADPRREDPDMEKLRADIQRGMGIAYRFLDKLDDAETCFAESERICRDGWVRGMVRLLPEQAELLRARAFHAEGEAAKSYLARASATYNEAKEMAQRIRNVNWFAHCLVGECELARTAWLKCRTPVPKDIDTKYANAFEVYCQISSRRWIVQTFISEALFYYAAPDAFPDKYAITADKLEQAERFSKELGLKAELAMIKRIKTHEGAAPELHPLAFL
jgi:hypothetical protein